MSPSLHRHTPGVVALDPRSLPVRGVSYLRSETGQPAAAQITLSRHDPGARHVRQWDPRLSARLGQGEPVTPSQTTLSSLSGRPLLSESVDAGWRLTLHGEAGQAAQRWDGRGSHWLTEYDEQVRPLSVREQAPAQASRIAERFTWGGAWEVAGNRCGRLLRHDDDAGSRLLAAYSLTGRIQDETRHFLIRLDLPDWPAAVADRDALLEPGDGAGTVYRHGPLDDLLEQTDALGNRQISRFDQAGQLTELTLRLNDTTVQPLLTETRYNALGQIASQTAGNGVVSQADYDPANGRLCRLSARRPAGGAWQDLFYAHDPVGNVLRIEDRSQPVSHFSNQKVEPVSTFRYDSLYRLIEASGREAASAVIGPGLPELAPAPGDTSRLLNYRQQYHYDASGNLLSLQHRGAQAYNRCMTVAENSNHALPWRDGVAPDDPRAGFDANGNLHELLDRQPLQWHALNRLHATRQVSRQGEANDEEHYRYGADGLRVRKVTTRLVAGRMQHSEVRYLPGLELRGGAGQQLAVCTAQAGRCAVRCLIWHDGQPDGIASPQLRYSLADLHDSCALELDGQARIISHEGYYPFGGTAWWAAHSALEADHKVCRYSGKERDATGLYAYGLRYYAPWLARWTSPDPAGDVDGLNRFVMVRNNPVTYHDSQGLNYSVKEFSTGPKAESSSGYHQSLGATGIDLPADQGQAADFAYNTNWTVRDFLHRGASNQFGDILASQYSAATYGVMLRQVLGSEPDWKVRAEHALAAATGFCDEFAAVSGYLMASSSAWPGLPIYLAARPDHHFALLGDYRTESSLVIDPWVTFPVAHPLSLSKNAYEMTVTKELLARMPGDPQFAISHEDVQTLRDKHYLQVPSEIQASIAQQTQKAALEGNGYLEASAMVVPQNVFYTFNDKRYAAAQVPETMWNRTLASLEQASAVRNYQNQARAHSR